MSEETSEDAPAAEGAGETAAAATESKPELRPLVVIDADPAERARVEAAAADLGRPVQALAPEAVTLERLAEVSRAAALVVAWDLAGRPGIDVLEVMARRPDARSLRLAMAATSATRAMVAAAVRAGATSFLSRPYDADELRHLLEGLS